MSISDIFLFIIHSVFSKKQLFIINKRILHRGLRVIFILSGIGEYMFVPSEMKFYIKSYLDCVYLCKSKWRVLEYSLYGLNYPYDANHITFSSLLFHLKADILLYSKPIQILFPSM